MKNKIVTNRTNRFLLLCLLIVILAGNSSAQTQITGNLKTYIHNFIDNIPTTNGGNQYQTPSSSDLNTWGTALTQMLAGNYSTANTTASGIDYRVVEYTDNSVTPNKSYYLLEKTSSSTNYWGTMIINPNATRRKIFIQSPHPRYDSNTGKQGFLIFQEAETFAFFVSGTHRCNSSDSTNCAGTTSVCGQSGAKYRKSDQAHVVDGTMFRATEILNNNIENLIVIQVHGFFQGDGDPDLIISNGTRATPTTDYLLRLRDNLLVVDDTLEFKIAHIDLTWTELVALTNTQGRLINGSSNPCTGSTPTSSTGRFLHVEQCLKGLRDNETNWKKLSQAIQLTFPVWGTMKTGSWTDTQLWMNESVPTDTSDVTILEAHTVTINSSANCRSITFHRTNSKLELGSGAELNITGDFTLASTTHNAFTSWASGAKIKFNGSANQMIYNLYKDASTFSSTFMELQVDKSGGKVTTEDSVRLNIGTSLEIINGTLELAYRADIEGRNLTGTTSTTPTITIQNGGVFDMVGSLSHIRSGTSGSNQIGKMTVFGTAYLRSTSTLGLNINNIDVKNGGVLFFDSFSNSAPNTIKTGTVKIEHGGVAQVNTVVDFWHSTSSLNLESGGEFILNSNPTSASNSFPNSFTNNGTVKYSLAGDQPVRSINYVNLSIEGSGLKSLEGNISVSGNLNLYSGKIITGSNTVTLGSSALLTEADGNTIIGNLTTTRTVTQNVLNEFGGIGVSINASGGDPGSTSVIRKTGTYLVANSNESIERYFQITPSNNSGLDATLTFYYDTSELNLLEESTLVLFRSTDLVSWEQKNGSVDVNLNKITLNNVNEFSYWTAASINSPLLVEMGTFTSQFINEKMIIKWTTISELNNYGFEIQRTSVFPPPHFENIPGVKNGWETIGFVQSDGNSIRGKDYRFIDETISFGTYYYRLKIIDNDGSYSYSKIISSEVSIPSVTELFQNFPNPFNPETNIKYSLSESGFVKLNLYSITGELLSQLVNEYKTAGRYIVKFNSDNLPSGIYYYRLTVNEFSLTKKLLIQK